jgi:hypothetical protein
MTTPSVTVAVPTRARPAALARCLRALEAQTIAGDLGLPDHLLDRRALLVSVAHHQEGFYGSLGLRAAAAGPRVAALMLLAQAATAVGFVREAAELRR